MQYKTLHKNMWYDWSNLLKSTPESYSEETIKEQRLSKFKIK